MPTTPSTSDHADEEPITERARAVRDMYQGYLDAHEQLVAGTSPSAIPELAARLVPMDEDTVFRFQSPEVELRGREAIERFMVDVRRAVGLREVPERVIEHGDLVVSFNRSSFAGADGVPDVPVVAVFQFDGDRIAHFWGFAGRSRS